MSQPEVINVTYNPGTGEVTKVYDRYKPEAGLTIYNEANATLITKDELKLYRTEATRNGNFLGMAKSSAKLTISVPATDAEGNSVSEKIIVTLSTSVYPSAASALVTDAVKRLAAFAVSAEGTALTTKLEI